MLRKIKTGAEYQIVKVLNQNYQYLKFTYSMPQKPRLFYLAWTTPSQRGGACLAMYRHFILRNDFDIFVASSTEFNHPNIPSLLIHRHPVIKRLSNTRLSRLVRQFEMLIEPYLVLKQVESICNQFSPDAIFTIPDNTLSWTAYLLAKKTGLPLITNFQDWWPKGQFTLDLEKPYPIIRELLEHRFYKMYSASSLVLCTSAGMQQKLGKHSNSTVLYPCPAEREPSIKPQFTYPDPDKPLRVIYAGTIINAYGRSVLNLAKLLRGRNDIEFHVYGPPPDWSIEDQNWMKNEGFYLGLVSHEELKSKLYEADACLVVMSFEEEFRVMMETSFTTKFLEYSQFGKPIIVWGPKYCQPIQIAQAYGCGLTVTSSNPNDVVSSLSQLRNYSNWQALAQKSWQAANSIFDSNSIHNILKQSIYKLVHNSHEDIELDTKSINQGSL